MTKATAGISVLLLVFTDKILTLNKVSAVTTVGHTVPIC